MAQGQCWAMCLWAQRGCPGLVLLLGLLSWLSYFQSLLGKWSNRTGINLRQNDGTKRQHKAQTGPEATEAHRAH